MIVYLNDITPPYEYETTAVYQCDPGYEITSGDRERTCTDDGDSPDNQWSGSAAVCSGTYLQL